MHVHIHLRDTYWYIMILYWIYSYTNRVVPATISVMCVLQCAAVYFSQHQDGSFTELCDDLPVFGAYHSAVFDHSTSRVTLFGGQCCVNGPYEYYNDATWTRTWTRTYWGSTAIFTHRHGIQPSHPCEVASLLTGAVNNGGSLSLSMCANAFLQHNFNSNPELSWT